jgi:subtilase family serine protease
VAVRASAGDSGYGTNYPSASQYVTAVGGTLLTKNTSVARGWDESVWGSASGGEGTGCGCSPYEPKPSVQNGVTTDCANRATADASPASGLATYDTLGQGGWLQVGGTSLASPLIAAAAGSATGRSGTC